MHFQTFRKFSLTILSIFLLVSFLFVFFVHFASSLHFTSSYFLPFSSTSFLIPVSCLFCIHFPFHNPPYSFLHYLFLRSLFVLLAQLFFLCTPPLYLFPLSFYSLLFNVHSCHPFQLLSLLLQYVVERILRVSFPCFSFFHHPSSHFLLHFLPFL